MFLFTVSSVQSPLMLSFAFENLGRQLRSIKIKKTEKKNK